MKKVSLFTLLPLAVGVFLGGCASEAEDVNAAESAVVHAEPITVENYDTHPTIVAIRSAVATIDSAPFAQTTASSSCGGKRIQWTDGNGKVRKVFLRTVDGEGTTEETAYYGEGGELLFVRYYAVAQFRLEDFVSAGKRILTLSSVPSGSDGWETQPEVAPMAGDGADDAVPLYDDVNDTYGDPSQVFLYSCDGSGGRIGHGGGVG